MVETRIFQVHGQHCWFLRGQVVGWSVEFKIITGLYLAVRWFLDVVPHTCTCTVVSFTDVTRTKYITVDAVESIAKANSPVSTSKVEGIIESSDEVALAGTGPRQQRTLVKCRRKVLLGLK